MNEIFKDSLEILEEGETSNIFSNEVEFVRLKLCKKERWMTIIFFQKLT